MNPRPPLLPILLLGLLAACGGSKAPANPPAASTLAYVDPMGGTFLLKRNPTLSSGGNLVLDLWGPPGATGCGASLTLALAGAAAWAPVGSTGTPGAFVANGDAFDLGSGTPILKGVVTGGTLVVTVAQKGTANPRVLNQALLRVALDLQGGTPRGSAITLTPDPGRCLALGADGTLSPIAVTASGITAQ